MISNNNKHPSKTFSILETTPLSVDIPSYKSGILAVALRDQIADNFQLKDELKQTDELLNNRPKNKRLAELFCQWLNQHQDGLGLCICELCKETKSWLDQMGDPVIHTTSGWVCATKEHKTRDVAAEIRDNTIQLTNGSYETELSK